MEYPPVKSKRDFSRRYKLGEFGNASRTWDNVEAWSNEHLRQLDNSTKLFHLRNKSRWQKRSFYNLTVWDLFEKLDELRSESQKSKCGSLDEFYISEMAPHSRGTIQGELMVDTGHYSFVYNTERVPMRTGFEINQRYASGSTAVFLLHRYMDGSSYDWLNVLIDRYPNHIIEFSCFEIPWGTIPNRNTVFWEVRDY